MIEVFDIKDNKVIPNANCYTIPELKALIEEYDDPIPALTFVYHSTSPQSPYMSLPEQDKETVLLADFPGPYSPEEEVIINAIEKMNILFLTPTRRFYLNAKRRLVAMGKYLATASITEGRDSNFSSFNMALSRVGKTIEEFKKMEKIEKL